MTNEEMRKQMDDDASLFITEWAKYFHEVLSPRATIAGQITRVCPDCLQTQTYELALAGALIRHHPTRTTEELISHAVEHLAQAIDSVKRAQAGAAEDIADINPVGSA